jgi:hypothetical protein
MRESKRKGNKRMIFGKQAQERPGGWQLNACSGTSFSCGNELKSFVRMIFQDEPAYVRAIK